MYVLVAEDDQKLGKLITHMLKKEAHTVDWFDSGHDVVESVQASAYDAVILDWMMPGEDGVSICRRLRAAGYTGGILLLTARDELDDRVCGLDAGADDYLVKPFEFAELLARVRALARRTRTPLVADTIEAGGLVLHCTEHTLRQNDTVIQLTPREFQLMELLLRNRGQVVPRDVILERIWGYDADISSNTLDAFVRLLRKKIDTSGSHKLIQNVRGIGYRLEV
ncbi:response regulator transcription factor [Aneurinibacillus uraniidurans]|uniref:response regulator transcription factor n=1 Tax=Aneurinibacillus uraniidurans TaxID=2966586 RepID=UPI00234BB1E8|nr:response regulator transcription factor [Aneurinibacillus sp. B1]WCN36351.1 response regulator transcription factor [Aneurinibacillus sp. B1]